MNRPIVYLSKDLLRVFAEYRSRPFTDIVPHSAAFLQDLLFHKGRICIDMDEGEIRHHALVEPFEIADPAERCFCIAMKQLLNQNKVYSCIDGIDIFLSERYEQFEALAERPNYVLLNCDKEHCDRIGKAFGVICISSDLSIREEDTRCEKHPIPAHKFVNYSDILAHLPACNSLIIEDPYLFHQDLDANFLERLMTRFCGSDLRVKMHLSLVYAPQRGTVPFNEEEREKIAKGLERIGQRFADRIEIEVFEGSTNIRDTKIHDRNIYSNSFWISCGLGFKERYTDLTIWDISPIGPYFAQCATRQAKIRHIIEAMGRTSANRLLYLSR